MRLDLMKGDCLEKMDKLISQGVQLDLILCDPPYGNMNGAGLDGWENATTEWDIAINPNDIYTRAEKLLRENGILILFSQEPYTSQLRTQTINNLQFCYPMIWKKDHFANALISKKAPVSYFEDISIFFKKYDVDFKNPLRNYAKNVMDFIGLRLKQINSQLGHRRAEHFFYWNTTQFKLPTRDTYNELINTFNINKMNGYIPYEELIALNNKYSKIFNLNGKNKKSNILEYKKDYGRLHPTQKPVDLLIDLINTFSNENDIVLDFTMGSGSTGEACLKTNRNFIGIERDDNYFNTSKNRINTYIEDNNLENIELNIT